MKEGDRAPTEVLGQVPGERAGDVMSTINNKYGRWAGDVVMNCNKGAHESLQNDGVGFIQDTERLARDLLELK